MKTAFVVDDDTAFQQFIQMHLHRFGYEVKSFIEGNGCLLHLHEKPDLIILDQNLAEEKCGLDYLREIKNITPDTPVLFLTSHNSIDAAVEAMKLGAMDFIEKNSASYIRIRAALERIEKQEEALKRSKKNVVKNFYWFAMGMLTMLTLIALGAWITDWSL